MTDKTLAISFWQFSPRLLLLECKPDTLKGVALQIKNTTWTCNIKKAITFLFHDQGEEDIWFNINRDEVPFWQIFLLAKLGVKLICNY